MGVGSNKFSTSIFISLKLNRKYNKSEVLGQSKTKELRFFALKNRKKGLITMSKLFMYGTSLEGIEQLMVMVPNFQPRRSGIIINKYLFYKE